MNDSPPQPPERGPASRPDLAEGTPLQPAAPPPRPGGTIIIVVPVLLVVITFLFWYQTWFGRPLRDQEMANYLSDFSAPHKTQHALSQLAERIARGDAAARRWYPQIVRLSGSSEPGLRLMAAWVMGQDNKSPEFHQALRKLVEDPEAMVRWNAALALTRFDDAAGEPQLRLMLRECIVRAPQAGTVSLRVKEGESVKSRELVARIQVTDGGASVEVLSPIAGRVEGAVARDGARVAAGDEVCILSPGDEQVWESLRALYLVGKFDDLGDVERFARGAPGRSERVREQALLTAQAIRRREANVVTGDKREEKASRKAASAEATR